MLELLDLDASVSKDDYEREKAKLRLHLLELQRACWFGGVPTVLVVEGWETAGKGDLVRFLTRRLEPRGFAVHVAVPPRTYELRMPWMARFWQQLPEHGMSAIWERSWYRHLFGPDAFTGAALHAAYDDVAGFERMIGDDGTVIVKLFLHLSDTERKRRRKAAAHDPVEKRKRERDPWAAEGDAAAFVLGVEHALERTDTESASWTPIAADNARYARLAAARTLVTAWDHALTSRGLPAPPVPDEEV